jgi:NADH dehydrogenase FAD-containing subunit
MGKNLVLVGGGHAHMVTLRDLSLFSQKGHKVTVIGPSAYHYYSGMGPGMLGSTYIPEDIRFATQKEVEKNGGTFILDKASRIDPNTKTVFLESGGSVGYDVLSCNAGSYVPKTCVSEDKGDIFAVKPIETLLRAQARIIERSRTQKVVISIVGGGPSSAEIAGNILQLTKKNGAILPEIRIFSGRGFMAKFPAKIRKKVLHSLTKREVHILEGSRVKEVQTGHLELESGEKFSTDLIFLALGVRPSDIFIKSGLPTGPDGGLLVNKYLQSPKYPEIFGGGDCIYFQDQPLNKVGVYAVRENLVLCHNLLATLEGKPLQAFDPGGGYLLIFNLGEGEGVLHKGWLTFDGKLAFLVKDYIDRKFMKKFQ